MNSPSVTQDQSNGSGAVPAPLSREDVVAYWSEQSRSLQWETPWTTALDDSDAPFFKWFADGTLNASVNCIDRHVAAGNGDRVAYHWIGEPGDTRDITYSDLLAEVSRAANALTALGITKGDRVALYLPMVPEAFFAILACARIGATHSIVFAGFSSGALRQRIDDAAAKLVITADGQYRRGEPAPLKAVVDAALAAGAAGPDSPAAPSVEHVLVIRRTGSPVDWEEGRDLWWHEAVEPHSTQHEPEAFSAEHPLFLLYTSGTTGKPKGIVHTTGGYLTQATTTHQEVFDLKPEADVFWCTADFGWVTGHTYVVYGPLGNGATSIVYEGTPNTPNQHRHFEIIEKYGVTTYYAAPTLIRTFMKWGDAIPQAHDLSSIRVLGSVGEPINPEAWLWFRRNFGDGTAPIVDTWWQTETGGQMISPLATDANLKPGSAQRALPGISATVVDNDGNLIGAEGSGLLVITQPWPGMLRGIWGDPERYRDTYWSHFADKGWYFAGDGARFDEDGDLWILGRVDDVMNISGHRISTAEVESALVGHVSVAEAAVIGASDETTGQGIVAFVILRSEVEAPAAGTSAHSTLIKDLRDAVSRDISPIAKPRDIFVVTELPKTRSGKIMRRLLRDVAEGREIGDTSTLADPSVMEAVARNATGKQ